MKLDKQSKKVLAVFGLFFLGFSFLPMALSFKRVKVELLEKEIRIKGIYGRTIKYSDIKEVILTSNLPRRLKRKNGISVNGIRKGLYVNRDVGDIYIYLDRKYHLPLIKVLELDSIQTYLSLETEIGNQNLYQLIENKVKNLH